MRLMKVCKPDFKLFRAFFACTLLAALVLLIFASPGVEKTAMAVYTLTEDSPALAKKKVAYLTFDDGPSTVTAQLLDLLKAKNVKASFFVVGEGSLLSEAERDALWKRAATEGHLLGLHTFSHNNYHKIYASAQSYLSNLSQLQEALTKATGQKATVYRFPGGSNNAFCSLSEYKEITSTMQQKGYEFVDWNVDARDAIGRNTTAAAVSRQVIRDAKKLTTPVILMHDIPSCKGSIEATGEIIDALQAAGYIFDTVDHLEITVHQMVKKT